jgi:hypothetical protein
VDRPAEPAQLRLQGLAPVHPGQPQAQSRRPPLQRSEPRPQEEPAVQLGAQGPRERAPVAHRPARRLGNIKTTTAESPNSY